MHRRIEILTGTFGKAFGGQGAFVVGSSQLIDYLVNTARSQIFSTGLPPVSAHWLCFVLRQIPLMREQRVKVDQLASRFRAALRDLGLRTDGSSNIVPVMVGDAARTVAAADRICEGDTGSKVRPPLPYFGALSTIRQSGALARFGHSRLPWSRFMQTAWLKRGNPQRCILFFAGWGMDPTPFAGIPAAGTDVWMVYDYRELSPVDLARFAAYEQLHLIAWSMGVWVAGHLFADPRASLTSLTAIGGTLRPIDQQQGIPPTSYNGIDRSVPDSGGFIGMIDEEALKGSCHSAADNDDLHRRLSLSGARPMAGYIYSKNISRTDFGRKERVGTGSACAMAIFHFFFRDWAMLS